MTSAQLGVSEDEFWGMLPREFERRVKAHNEKQIQANKQVQETEEARFYNMVNAFGMVMVGKKWKTVKPSSGPVENFEERERRALERHFERRRLKGRA